MHTKHYLFFLQMSLRSDEIIKFWVVVMLKFKCKLQDDKLQNLNVLLSLCIMLSFLNNSDLITVFAQFSRKCKAKTRLARPSRRLTHRGGSPRVRKNACKCSLANALQQSQMGKLEVIGDTKCLFGYPFIFHLMSVFLTLQTHMVPFLAQYQYCSSGSGNKMMP